MPANDIIGFAAATLTTASFIPQALHTYRMRDVSGISLAMYSLFTVGVAMWLLYGWMTGSWPIMVANAITLTLVLTILAIKLRGRTYGRSAAFP
jgi:MtN3 and saliva related transmembrane protein